MTKFIGLDKVEEILLDRARKKIDKGKVESIDIKKSEIVNRGKYKNYTVKAEIKYKDTGIIRDKEKSKGIKAEIDAKDGTIIKYKEI